MIETDFTPTQALDKALEIAIKNKRVVYVVKTREGLKLVKDAYPYHSKILARVGNKGLIKRTANNETMEP